MPVLRVTSMARIISGYLLILILGQLEPAMAQTKPQTATIQSVHALADAAELSGLLWQRVIDPTAPAQQFLAVSDGKQDTQIIELNPAVGPQLRANAFLDLNNLPGFATYRQQLAERKDLKKKQRRLDFEAMASCGQQLFLASERSRDILRVTLQNKLAVTPVSIDPAGQEFLESGKANAGIEALACHGGRPELYVMTQAESHRGLILDWQTGATKGYFTLPKTLHQDETTDMQWQNGHLYILRRSSAEIVKFSLSKHQVVDRLRFGQELTSLYGGKSHERAEGLAFTNDAIWLAMDADGDEVSEAWRKRWGLPQGARSTLIKLAKPPNF